MGGRNQLFSFSEWRLSRLQVSQLSIGYTDVILKVELVVFIHVEMGHLTKFN